MNIARNIENARRLFPDKPAILFEDRTITFAQLDHRVNALARGLRSKGIGPGDRVALFLPNIPGFIETYFAVQKIGAIAVALSSALKERELTNLLIDCQARLIFTVAALESVVPESLDFLEEVIVVDGDSATIDDLAVESDELFPACDCEPGEPAVILYTSGTTGIPKGATLSQENLVSNTSSFAHHAGMRPEDRLALFLPLFHCFAQNVVMNAGFNACATLVLEEKFVPGEAIQTIKRQGTTMLFGVPPVFQALHAMAPVEDLRSVRFCLSGAAILPTETGLVWEEKFGLPISIGYGATETSPFASFNSRFKFKAGSLGTPGDGIEMKIVDPDGKEQATGELGEIIVRGPNIMLGYWNRPDETAEVVKDGWFHTGDIGRRDDEGYFFVVDRVKDMINVGGLKVYPAEVEDVMLKHPEIKEVAVFAGPDAGMGELVHAHVVPRDGSRVEVGEILDFVRPNLADYKVPSRIEIVESIPKSPTGKYLKKELRAAAAESTGQAEGDQTTGITEEVIQGWILAWFDRHLELDGPVDLREPFHNYGLSSLMAVNLVAELQDRLGLKLSPTATWNYVDVASLSGFLAEEKAKASGEAPSSPDNEAAATTESLKKLSDSELARQLRDELNSED